MNLIKLVRHFIEPHTRPFLLGTSWSGLNREIRWQSTDIPPKTESTTDISTNVKEEKRSNLMEFFDTGDRLYESKIIHGRWWRLDDLRVKSNSDLHKLWYVLLKERNRLLTMEEEYRFQHELFPSPERIDKVEESMRNILSVVRERDIAYNLLETGKTGELTPEIRETSFGLTRFYQPKMRIVPFYKNRYYQLLWGKQKPAKWLDIFKRRYNEFQEHQNHIETNRVRKLVAKVIKKYPHLRDDEEFVLEEYKKRQDFEHFPIPRRMAQYPRLRPYQTLWNEDEYIEKGVFQDPNSDDFQQLQQERNSRLRRGRRKA